MVIGIDMDDTICSTNELIIVEADKYDKEVLGGTGVKDVKAYEFNDMLGWAPEMKGQFFKDRLEYIMSHATIKEDAKEVLRTIHKWQDYSFERYGTHFVQASDEWYLIAGEELPQEDRYDGYTQLENGVGMIRLLMDEFREALSRERKHPFMRKKELSVATGRLAAPFIRMLCDEFMEKFPKVTIHVYEIRNDFFGERITVTGLLTGQDILAQLKGKVLGEILYLPENVLRSGEHVLLDDVTVEDISGTLQVRTDIVKSSGYDFVNAFVRKKDGY